MKPRTQEELDAWAALGISAEDWNASAGRADDEWALAAHERGVGLVNDRTEMVGTYNVVAANYGAYKQKGR